MIETVDIYYFLKTGNFTEFREIQYGMKREAIIMALGEPEDSNFSRKKFKLPTIFFYGNLEFHFEKEKEGRLRGIQIIPRISEEKINMLDINYGSIFQSLEYESFCHLMKKENIHFEILFQEFDGEDVKRIITSGGVQCIFQNEYDGIFQATKISKFIAFESPLLPRMKQVSFSIPASDYEQLRQRAIQQRKSIANLCKDLIIKQMNKDIIK